MLRLGMFIGDRYEILDQIGSGGMSDVYKGKDHKLNRFVAVKVLKNEFSNDKNFVSKFRIEAQSAAGLAHPNIVNVYDVGEDEGVHYIVMELVEGITLKSYIQKKGKLSVKEAISIAIQMSMGIEAAHNNHIIHRDIKPQNIIISRDGKVKVTDFGIARAASSNTISSNVMGSVHYTSPEQARGGYSDEKSDIYSLGITMYEMLTGKVPFDGDNTVAVAIQHIQDEMVSPRQYSPEIPVSLEQIIFKCTQKSPDRRYDKMSQVIADLKHSLVEPDADFVKVMAVDANAKTVMITDDEISRIKGETVRTNSDFTIKPDTGVKPGKTLEEVYDEDEDEDDDENEEMSPTVEKIMNVLGIIAAIVIACLALYLGARALGLFSSSKSSDNAETKTETTTEVSSEKIEMIDIVGKTYEEAKDALNAIGLGIKDSSYENSDVFDSGYVIKQDVEAGKEVDKNTTINVTVSTGDVTFEIPDVEGMDESTAKAKLADEYNLNVTVENVSSSSVEAGNVIRTVPVAGTSVKKGSDVTIVVSTGVDYSEITVPKIVGMTENEAKYALQSAGLKVGTIDTAYSDSYADGVVMSQGYEANKTVAKNTEVSFVVSMGSKDASSSTDDNTEAEGVKMGKLRIESSDLPQGFSSGIVRFDLTQNGTTTKVLETELTASDFPYETMIPGAANATTGTVKMYIDGVAVEGTFTVSFSVQ